VVAVPVGDVDVRRSLDGLLDPVAKAELAVLRVGGGFELVLRDDVERALAVASQLQV
jgi:hypothetical protein